MSHSLPEMILLIHGTGAGRRSGECDPIDRRWWELGSMFGFSLVQELGSDGRNYELSDAFVWGDGGANSETARGIGGRDLERFLRSLDEAGRKYHLVGHSHGGSVIWSCLRDSVKSGRLEGLQSWTTVGTPFLRFKPSAFALWVAAPGVLSVAAIAGLFARYPDAVSSVLSALRWNGNHVALAGLGTVALAVLWVLGASLVLLGTYGSAVLRSMFSAQSERLATALYAQCYCGLFHPLDEPINGLMVTLLRPANILPRPAMTSQGVLAHTRRWLAEVLSQPVDDLTWDTLARRLQGNDLTFGRLVDVAAVPFNVSLPSEAFSTADLEDVARAADAHSVDMMRNARQVLASLAATQGGPVRFQSLASVVDWSGVIHTSYFERRATWSRIASHIAELDEIGRASCRERVSVLV